MALINVYFGDSKSEYPTNWNRSITWGCGPITTPPSPGDTYSNNGVNFNIVAAAQYGYNFVVSQTSSPPNLNAGNTYTNNGHTYTLVNEDFSFVFTVSGVTTVPAIGEGYSCNSGGIYLYVTATNITAGSGTITLHQGYAFQGVPTATGTLSHFTGGTGQANITYSAMTGGGTVYTSGTAGAPQSSGTLTRSSGSGAASFVYASSGASYNVDAGGSGTSTATGTLTRVSGSGDATITFYSKADVGWYSSLGFSSSCCCYNGTPLARLPNPSTDYVYIAGGANVTTGPIGGYSGAIGCVLGNGGAAPQISTGSYSGTVTFGLYGGAPSAYGSIISGGTFTGSLVIGAATLIGGSGSYYGINITGGTFNCPVSLANGSSYSAPWCKISGGTFTGNFSVGTTTGTGYIGAFAIAGGTYAPTASFTVNVKTGAIVSGSMPHDPGFLAGGGTYSPNFTITNLPGILGAGLL